jgi:tetratricopeptide (TPR) repeat protein
LDASVLFFFGALLSKVFAVIFPGLLIALDLGVLRRRETARRLLEEKWAFILAAGAALALGVRAQSLSGAAPGLEAAGWGDRFAVLAWTPGWTVWKTIVPTGLGPFVSVDWASEPWRFWPVAALSALLAAGLIFVRRKPALFWLLAAWFLALSPALGLFKSGWQSSADRYSLIPDAVLAVGAAFLLRRAGRRAQGAAAAACLLLAAMTFVQTGVWKDSVSLWTRALRTGSKSAQAYSGLSDALYEAGRPGEARALAERLNAGSDRALVLMADARYAAGDFAGAADFMKKAVEQAPKSPQLRLKYASALYLAVRPREAAEQDALAIELFPEGDVGKAEAEYSLGAVQVALGQAEEAEESLTRALRLDPTRRDARELLDKLRARMARPPKR